MNENFNSGALSSVFNKINTAELGMALLKASQKNTSINGILSALLSRKNSILKDDKKNSGDKTDPIEGNSDLQSVSAPPNLQSTARPSERRVTYNQDSITSGSPADNLSFDYMLPLNDIDEFGSDVGDFPAAVTNSVPITPIARTLPPTPSLPDPMLPSKPTIFTKPTSGSPLSFSLPLQKSMTVASPAVSNEYGGLLSLKLAAEKAYPENPTMQRVAITQAILESGLQDGTPSALAKRHNYFGIKAPGTAGVVNMPTKEFIGGSMRNIKSGFGANKTPADSFMQYRDLMNKKRYAPVVSSGTPQQAFSALQRSGYATDPAYAKKLSSLYDKYVVPLYL